MLDLGRDDPGSVVVVYVVLVGSFQGPPDKVVGPFEAHDDAVSYAVASPGDSEHRYSVVIEVTPP